MRTKKGTSFKGGKRKKNSNFPTLTPHSILSLVVESGFQLTSSKSEKTNTRISRDGSISYYLYINNNSNTI